MKKVLLFFLLCSAMCIPATAADNLLDNGGFDSAKANALYGYDWDSWQCKAITTIETTDILEGEQALRFTEANTASNITQEVSMTNEADGQIFELTFRYKLLSYTAEKPVWLNCVWEHPRDGVLNHDEEVLTQTLSKGDGWQTVTIKTSKPVGATKLVVSMAYAKKTLLLLDDWRLERTEATEPWLTVSPATLPKSDAKVGETKTVGNITIRQGHLTQPVSVYLTGTGSAMFSLDKQQVSAAEEVVKLTYTPTAAGQHRAMLIIESSEVPTLNQTLSVSGSASDPTLKPEITITPTTLEEFECTAGETITKTILVNGINCTGNIEISLLNNQSPGVFTINNTLMPANVQNGRSVITFHPLAAGEYSATVYYQTEGGTAQRIALRGTATSGEEKPDDFNTEFVFDNKSPQRVLIERFDNAGHNEQLQLANWQNVVVEGKKPWLSIDELNGEQMDCAKATAFVSGQTDDTEWEIWLVTPALDYKNAANQVFTFRVRGDYLFDGMTTALELYYIDATDPANVHKEKIAAGIPSTADEKGKWVDIHVNLAGSDNIADVFYMAFRYVGPSGTNGAVTYYVDDITWGNPNLPIITCDHSQVAFQTKPSVAGGVEFKVTGQNLTEPIKITLGGANPNSFAMATATTTNPSTTIELPAEGGVAAIALLQDAEGVYEAYMTMNSKGAATIRIPVSCLVKNTTAIDQAETNDMPMKRLVNGRVFIQRGEALYDILGNNAN